jgi:pimeloyl-ACP methyl ester carboxylesterase
MSATTNPSTVRRIVRSGDGDLYVEQRGAGRDVLFLSGFGDTVEAWEAQISALSDRYRCTVHDTRGTGRTVAPPESITIPQLAADAAAVIEAMGLEQPHVIGFSGGGIVAQELALSYPELVGSLVLSGTFSEIDEKQQRMFEGWAALAAAAESAHHFMRLFLTQIYTAEAHADGRVDEWARELAEFEPAMSDEAFTATLEAYKSWSSTARLGEIGVPTLVLAGEVDFQVSWRRCREMAARIPGAEFVLIEAQAHQPFQEVPDEYNAIVTGFWSRVDS